MIQIQGHEIKARYLPFNQDFCTDFPKWLKELGISYLSFDISPSDWVTHDLLNPVLRVDIPESFYLTWKNYPALPANNSKFPKNDEWCLYCTPYSFLTSEEPPKNWFLHVFDQPNSEAAEFLRHRIEGKKEIPSNRKHPRGYGIKFNTCWLYFSHWQGYYLIDLLSHVNGFPSVPNVPDVFKRIELFKKHFRKHENVIDTGISSCKSKWEKHGKFLELLSYYRTMLGLSIHYSLNKTQKAEELREEGRTLLANHLNVTPKILEDGVEELLTIYREWKGNIERGSQAHEKAIGQLRKDIYYSVEWLCFLTGNTIDTYFRKWKYDSFSPRSWVELKTALPFEYKKSLDYFLDLAPLYLKDINEKLPERDRLDTNELKELIEGLFKKSIGFRRFCRAFKNLHDYIDLNDEVDLRDFDAFFDHFLLLALRTETILYELADQDNLTNNKGCFQNFLKNILLKPGSLKVGVDLAMQLWKNCTSLKRQPSNPFQVIQEEIRLKRCDNEPAKIFAEQFLIAGMMRNYFAHHHYLDKMMAERKHAAQGLVSLLVTVLFLAYNREIK